MSVFDELDPPYSTIVADPPWHYDGFAGSRGRGGVLAGVDGLVGVHVKPLPYASMSLGEIAALPVAGLADRDAWLFLWTTNRYLPSAMSILDAWGFRYRQTLVWHKTGNPTAFGGTFAPNHAEFLLVAAKGSPNVKARQPGSVIAANKPNKSHSAKPAVFGDFIEAVAPGPYVELFARAPRLGWDSWGKGYEIGVAS